jgi:hypothetical protein
MLPHILEPHEIRYERLLEAKRKEEERTYGDPGILLELSSKFLAPSLQWVLITSWRNHGTVVV